MVLNWEQHMHAFFGQVEFFDFHCILWHFVFGSYWKYHDSLPVIMLSNTSVFFKRSNDILSDLLRFKASSLQKSFPFSNSPLLCFLVHAQYLCHHPSFALLAANMSLWTSCNFLDSLWYLKHLISSWHVHHKPVVTVEISLVLLPIFTHLMLIHFSRFLSLILHQECNSHMLNPLLLLKDWISQSEIQAIRSRTFQNTLQIEWLYGSPPCCYTMGIAWIELSHLL